MLWLTDPFHAMSKVSVANDRDTGKKTSDEDKIPDHGELIVG